MRKPSPEVSTPTILATINQLQGVEHTLAHPVGNGAHAHSVIVWTHDGAIEATVESAAHLDELVSIVEDHVTAALTSKKYRLNFRITY
jgi:hypothetical protein